jgi:hypothetical protein
LEIKKLTSEYEIMLQIKDIFQTEGIEFSGVLQLPGIHFSKELVEKLHPSEAVWSSKELFAVHLQKYYAARYQDSIDAQFQEIHDAMKSDTIFVLEDYKEFFEMVAQKTGYYHKEGGYYGALASRYKYSRILSTKIIDARIESLEVKDITKLLWTVHELTGSLDSFKLVNKSYHGTILPEEERTKLALITVSARGMNIGLKGIAKSIQEKYSVWRLINFNENYVSIENLEEANRTIIRKWDALNFGGM